MAGLVDFIEARSPQIMKEYRGKLEQKVTELLGENPFDENKMAAEVILYADKICVDEETVRLKAISTMQKLLERRRRYRPQAGLYRTGNEPRSQHHFIESK